MKLLPPIRIRRTPLGSSAFNSNAEEFLDTLFCPYNLDYQDRLEDVDDAAPHCTNIPTWGSEVVQSALSNMSISDRNLLHLYYIEHKTQSQIARRYRSSQANICRRLTSAGARLKFWCRLPPCPDRAVWLNFFRPTVWAVVDEYRRDYVQARAARRLRKRLRRPLSQSTVHQTLYRALWLLTEAQSPDSEAMKLWLRYALRYGPYISLTK